MQRAYAALFIRMIQQAHSEAISLASMQRKMTEAEIYQFTKGLSSEV